MGRQHKVGAGAAGSQFQEGIPDPNVEFVSFGFEPVLRGITGGPALAAHRRVNIQKDSEVGFQAGSGPRVNRPHCILAQVPSGSLVGNGRIDVPVRQNNLAALKRRPDDLARVGGPGRREDQGFGVGINVAVAMVKDQGAKFLADGRSAGFPGPQDGEAARFKGICKPGCLGGLAGTIPALKCDEKARPLFTHRSSLPILTRNRRLPGAICGQYQSIR
jgi:hypothetical protein